MGDDGVKCGADGSFGSLARAIHETRMRRESVMGLQVMILQGEALIEAHGKGASIPELCRVYGMSPESVARCIKLARAEAAGALVGSATELLTLEEALIVVGEGE